LIALFKWPEKSSELLWWKKFWPNEIIWSSKFEFDHILIFSI